jgi:hypothetical protein
MYHYLLYNETLESLHLSFVETGFENNSNLFSASPQANQPSTLQVPVNNKIKRDPQIMVPADKMEMTTKVFQPLSLLSNNRSIKSNYFLAKK